MIKALTLIEENYIISTIFILVIITIFSIKDLIVLPGGDKLHHIIAYAILVTPITLKVKSNWVLFIFIMYSCVIEVLQPYISRCNNPLDIAANSMGILIGVTIIKTLRRIL